MKAKLLFSVFFISIFFSGIIAQPLAWSNEIIVANGNTYGDVRPRIAVTTGNIPVVMWGGGTTTQPLYVARWNGSGFNTPVMVTPSNMDPFIDTWAGADMAANGNDVFVVFKVQPEMTNNIYVVKSSDGGITWGSPTQVDAGIAPYDRFPSIAVSSVGNPSVMLMTFDSTWNSAAYAVASSSDGGFPYGNAIPVSTVGMSGVCDCCPGYMAIKGNYFVPAWRRNNSNTRDMWAAFSTDGGITYPTGADLDNTDWYLSSCPSSGPSPFLTNDSLITAFMSGASGDNRIYINSLNYLNAGQGFTDMVDVGVPSAAIQNFPFLAGSGDTVGMVYQEALNGNIDAIYSYSYTGASGLINNSFVLNNATAGNQKNPHIAYSSNSFHFVWVDDVTGNVMYKSGTIPLSISENQTSKSIAAYPNPSNGSIRIDVSGLNEGTGSLEVFDMTGKIVEAEIISGTKNFLIAKQKPGIYFVKLTSQDHVEMITKVVFY
ncbi:hypothetical protein BH09BAC5_BH09BAC5_24540 [soil metagenome]